METVEDFWGVHNNVIPPSKAQNGSNYRMFKDEIEPKWEDENNKKGGAIIVKANTSKNSRELDDRWMHLQLACIGENYTDGEAICGVNVSIRAKNSRLEIWTRNSEDDEVNKRIAQETKDFLEMGSEQVSFKAHYDSHAWTL
ncbi:translation initiation factor 4E [Acrasis kona]|uniref:Translation initiation factor 4E n=1 Tax=Acrasis kona TaxID=1008807 RepID=A0AAW2ZLB9_9EUKA